MSTEYTNTRFLLPACKVTTQITCGVAEAMVEFENADEDIKLQLLAYRGEDDEEEERIEDRIVDASMYTPARRARKPHETLCLTPRKEPSLGDLEVPQEVLRMILVQLDTWSLWEFKAVNSRARSCVFSLPEYKDVLDHAPTFVATLYLTRTSQYFSIARIHGVLVTPACIICGRFGGFVFIPGLKRCCQRCAENDIEFMPLSPNAAKKEYGVGNKDLNLLPTLAAVPGFYAAATGQTRLYKGKRNLISRAEARKLGRKDLVERQWDKRNIARAFQRYMCLTPVPVLDPKNKSLERGLQCLGCKLNHERHPYPCLYCQISLPGGVDKECTLWEDTRHLGTTATMTCRMLIARARLHSRTEILAHFVECPGAQTIFGRKKHCLEIGQY
ncbi:hypothetical protein MMC28_004082 [Mycoblastus sanguinarius]|nr:hypothetical protein [Mycoblastus sanguinarius]